MLHAKSGHLGASSSSLELMVSLYFGGILNYDSTNPKNPDRDRVLVRGHVGPLRYKIFSLIGWIPEEELKTYRQLGSRLQGHESMELVPGVDITPSGSLGMLLSYGAGSAAAAKRMGKNFKTYVFLGDGEEQEGNVSEAARHVANMNLDNIVVILDKNLKQLSGPTLRVDSNSDVRKIWEGYGWDVIEIKNGNSISEILAVFNSIKNTKKPALVVANTTKGLGIINAEENFCGYHTISSCPIENLEKSLAQQSEVVKKLGINAREEVRKIILGISLRQSNGMTEPAEKRIFSIQYSGKEESLDGAFTEYLQKINKSLSDSRLRFYMMAADIIKSPDTIKAGLIPPIIYIDVGIREQHLFAMAHGLSVTDNNSKILLNVKDSFLYRASDQLNVMAQANTPIVLVSDDAGVSGGKNGSTHQSTGQPGLLLTMPKLKFLEPADGTDLFNCLNWALTKHSGPVYIRMSSTLINELKVEHSKRNIKYYKAFEPQGVSDAVIVGSGFPLVNAVNAAIKLSEDSNINVSVVNVIDMKSLDCNFSNTMLEHGKPVLTVYNGNQFVLKSAVATAVMDNSQVIPSRVLG
ncbi:hypothetical protein M1141_01340 [Candidatus Marsarchaeota archaeon]|nr:hypothetical protein [Candidatus Marsarchaeota archaeon]